ncbi:MAG: hypothetical protein KDD64_08865 [Bdellovibrionales bacterium]|nr:hypothetical protein [Bdellovibrionales bacterium]
MLAKPHLRWPHRPSLILFLSSAFVALFILPLQNTSAQVSGRVIVTMEDAGGNGAAYGLVYLGAEGRTQSMSCPRASLGSKATGRVQCDTTFGSPQPNEWQSFDIVTVTIVDESSTEIPIDVRPPDSAYCNWNFEGFTGACTGMGAQDPNVTNRIVWTCQFVLPESGDVHLGVKIFGQDGFNRPCPAIPYTGFPTPIPTPTASPTPSDPALGSEIVRAINQVTDDILDGMRNQKIRRLVEKITRATLGPTNVPVTVQAQGTTSTARTLGAKSSTSASIFRARNCPTIVAKGKVKTSPTRSKKLKVRFTKRGRACLKNKKNVDIDFRIWAQEDGAINALASETATLNVRERTVY